MKKEHPNKNDDWDYSEPQQEESAEMPLTAQQEITETFNTNSIHVYDKKQKHSNPVKDETEIKADEEHVNAVDANTDSNIFKDVQVINKTSFKGS